VAGTVLGQHAVTLAEHVQWVDGPDDVLVQRQLVAGLFGPSARTVVVDEHERERERGQTQADGYAVRGRETHVDHHEPVDEHSQYASHGDRTADHAVLDRSPFVRCRVGHVRVDAVEQHRRAAGQRHRGRLRGGRQRRRHGPHDGAVQRQRVRQYLSDDGQHDERPAAAVPVAPRTGHHGQGDGHQLRDERLPTVDGRHHVLSGRLVAALGAHPAGHLARRVARLVQQQVGAQAPGEHHRDEVEHQHRFDGHAGRHAAYERHGHREPCASVSAADAETTSK